MNTIIKNEVAQKSKMRESPAGIHFYTLFQDCARKGYLKYINGLKPLVTSPPLLFGSAFHEGKAKYWEGPYDADGMVKEFDKVLLELKPQYEDVNIYLTDVSRGHRMIDNWLTTWHDENQQRYDVMEVEHQYEIPIGPNGDFIFTVRPDVVLKDKQFGKLIIEDTKSTGWSVDMVFKTNALNDQLTSYIWALSKMRPEWHIETARIDCSYAKQSKVDSQRGLEVYRSKQDLVTFEMGLYGLILEVSQKYKSLQKYPWPLLFPRNGGQCFKYNKPCEYSQICRMNIPIGTVPPGFVLDEWASLDKDMAQAQASFRLDDFKIKEKETTKGETN